MNKYIVCGKARSHQTLRSHEALPQVKLSAGIPLELLGSWSTKASGLLGAFCTLLPSICSKDLTSSTYYLVMCTKSERCLRRLADRKESCVSLSRADYYVSFNMSLSISEKKTCIRHSTQKKRGRTARHAIFFDRADYRI